MQTIAFSHEATSGKYLQNVFSACMKKQQDTIEQLLVGAHHC